MFLIKKLAFAPLFLISFLLLLYFFNPFLKSVDLIFSLDLNTFYQLIILSSLILLTSLFFVLFTSLALDWKVVLPVVILSAAAPFLFIEIRLAIILAVAVFISMVLTLVSLEGKLKSYLTFDAGALFSPSVKQLAGFLILGLSLIYYLSINSLIQQQGFQIPDSLIDTALKFTPQPNLPVQGFKYDRRLVAQLPQITSEQLELLKKNPEVLKQYNIDPKMLENITPQTPSKTNKSPAASSLNMNDLLKQTVKDQVQTIIKPYQSFIPPLLAALFFFTLHSLLSLASVFLNPLLWLIFKILEKSGFIHFETEMREAKKLVV